MYIVAPQGGKDFLLTDSAVFKQRTCSAFVNLRFLSIKRNRL